jgi:MFS family permease
VFLALGIPALFAPLAGHLADRVARRPLLLITNAATGLMVLSLLAVHSRAQLWIIYLVAFCYGMAFGIPSPAQPTEPSRHHVSRAVAPEPAPRTPGGRRVRVR